MATPGATVKEHEERRERDERRDHGRDGDRKDRDRDRDRERDKVRDRDRDRDSKRESSGSHRHRSRSRSKSRSPERHHKHRSPEHGGAAVPDADKPRLKPRSSGWDAKPAGAENLPPAAIAAMLAPQPRQSQADTNRRKLYIGAIPSYLQESEILDAALMRMKEKGAWGPHPLGPIVSVQVNFEKQYAFMEFRTAEEATLGLAILDSLTVNNATLRFRRPKNYSEDALGMASGPNVMASAQSMAAVLSPALISQLKNPTPATLLDLSIPGAALSGALLPAGDDEAAASCGAPTHVVVWGNVASADELADEEYYREIVADMRVAAVEHGPVVSFHIPRPYRALAQQLQEPIGELPQPRHIGKCFVEYYEVEDAARSHRSMAGRTYGGRTIIAHFFPDKELETLREENERTVQRSHDTLAEALRVQRRKRQENPFFALPPPGGVNRPLAITSSQQQPQAPLAIEAPPQPSGPQLVLQGQQPSGAAGQPPMGGYGVFPPYGMPPPGFTFPVPPPPPSEQSYEAAPPPPPPSD